MTGHGLSAEKIGKLFDRIAEQHKQGNEPAVNPSTSSIESYKGLILRAYREPRMRKSFCYKEGASLRLSQTMGMNI
jgi:hypothetical protein